MKKKKNWDDPYYHYEIGKGSRKKKLTIDVTASIPNFEVPVAGLPDVVAEFEKRGYSKILDFGAGKLRNSLFLLKKKFKVWAVEFPQAFLTPDGEKRLKAAKSSDGFFLLKYPKKFLKFGCKLDAAIVVNVINIVPEKSDRLRILRECAKRLRRGGLLLLMTQYGEPNYDPGVTKRRRFNDGWVYKLDQRRQTFYKEYEIPDLQALVPKKFYKEIGQPRARHHKVLLLERL